LENNIRIIVNVLLILTIISIIRDMINKFNEKYKNEEGFINKVKLFSKDMLEVVINFGIVMVFIIIFWVLISRIFYIQNKEMRFLIDIGEKVPYLSYIILTFWPFFISSLKWILITSKYSKKFWEKEINKESGFENRFFIERKNQDQIQKSLKEFVNKYLNKTNMYLSFLGFAIALSYHFLGFYIPGILYLIFVLFFNTLEY
jgi:hypothetical protein